MPYNAVSDLFAGGNSDSRVLPSRIHHVHDHTFSDVWTGYTEDFKTFYKNMRDDMETYKDVKAVKAKPGQPQNFYCISMVPWLNFTGYSAYTESGTPMLFPIITCGKFTEHDGILTMPFCVNIAHAAADGYHTSMFINELLLCNTGFCKTAFSVWQEA